MNVNGEQYLVTYDYYQHYHCTNKRGSSFVCMLWYLKWSNFPHLIKCCQSLFFNVAIHYVYCCVRRYVSVIATSCAPLRPLLLARGGSLSWGRSGQTSTVSGHRVVKGRHDVALRTTAAAARSAATLHRRRFFHTGTCWCPHTHNAFTAWWQVDRKDRRDDLKSDDITVF